MSFRHGTTRPRTTAAASAPVVRPEWRSRHGARAGLRGLSAAVARALCTQRSEGAPTQSRVRGRALSYQESVSPAFRSKRLRHVVSHVEHGFHATHASRAGRSVTRG